MKTLCKDGVSVYLLDDADTVNILDDMIEIRGVRDFNIADMSTTNATLHENVTAPANWKGGKYTFDGVDWIVVIPDIVPGEVSMRQARLALLESGHLAAIDAAMVSADEASQITWSYASTVERGSALVATMAAVLGLSDDDVDTLFKLAVTK